MDTNTQTPYGDSTSAWRRPLDPLRSCFTCAHFSERTPGADSVVCVQRGHVMVFALPDSGCCYWRREAGADAACEV